MFFSEKYITIHKQHFPRVSSTKKEYSNKILYATNHPSCELHRKFVSCLLVLHLFYFLCSNFCISEYLDRRTDIQLLYIKRDNASLPPPSGWVSAELFVCFALKFLCLPSIFEDYQIIVYK